MQRKPKKTPTAIPPQAPTTTVVAPQAPNETAIPPQAPTVTAEPQPASLDDDGEFEMLAAELAATFEATQPQPTILTQPQPTTVTGLAASVLTNTGGSQNLISLMQWKCLTLVKVKIRYIK
jgi:hypothetical protein